MMFNTGDLILDAVILSIVARTPEGTYGYKITQDVRSKMDVPESTFYPLLKQMQMDGYLEVYHKDLGGRSRRFYKITESGKERLEFCQQNWTNYLQSASSLLMSAPTQQENAPVAEPVMPAAQPVMVEAPAVEPVAPVAQPVVPESPVEPEFSIASSSEAMTDMEFSIGGEEVVSEGNNLLSDEVDLFELDSTASKGVISIEEPAAPQPVMVETPVAQPVMTEAPAVEPVAPVAQPVMVEAPAVEPMAPVVQPVMVEAPAVEPMAPVAQPVMTEAPAVEPMAPVAQSVMTEAPAVEPMAPVAQPVMTEASAVEPMAPVAQPVMTEAPAVEELDDEADFLAEMALGDAEVAELEEEVVEETETLENNMSELENLISQLRSFETTMNAHREYAENNNSESNNINITDLNGVAALLNPSPQETAPVDEQATSQPATEEVVATESSETTRYAEVRNPDTDDSVNSLVELLKDEPVKKSGFFNKVAKASNSLKNMVSDTANAAMEAEKTAPQKAPEESVATENKIRPIKYTEVRNPDTDDSVNSLVDLLKDEQPTQKARFFKPKSAKEAPVEKVIETTQQNTNNIKLKEVRNPETDDAVNSLVDLLKDDGASSKPKLFRAWGNKSSNTSTPVAETKSTPAANVELKEVRNPETDDAVNSLVDLLKDDGTSSKPKLFRSRAQKASAVEKAEAPANKVPVPTVAKEAPTQPVREVAENSNSVDSLVDLLKADTTEQKPVSIFGKASAKSYTKVSAPEAPATPVASVEPTASVAVQPTPVQDTVIPEPVVSEPRVFAPKISSVTNKPTTAKTFEAKAASPNARPVETTATITKPLEAKAISTNPAVAKPAEAKSVETKAVVTPKAEAAKPDTAPAVEEKAKEEIPMDSFKYRLMQANLLPEEK